MGWAVCAAVWTKKGDPTRVHRHASAVSNAVGTVLSKAEIVFDKFHVLQHASAALDDVRRQEFFRAGAVMREHGRGKTLAVAATLEDRPRVEAPRTPNLVRRESPPLKLKWTTAHPIRSARDLAAFLTAQPLYSNR